MPAIKLALPFPEKVCFVSNRAVLQKRKPAEGETPEQALTERFYLPCFVTDSTRSSPIARVERDQKSSFEYQKQKTVWDEKQLSLTTWTEPTRKIVSNDPFTVRFTGFSYEKTTCFASVVLGEEAFMVTVPLGEFTEAVRLGGITPSGDMGCKFVFHNVSVTSTTRLIPLGSTLYMKLTKKQDNLISLEEKNRYLSAGEIVAGNVYLDEVTKDKYLCMGWSNGKVLCQQVKSIPGNDLTRFVEAVGNYDRNFIDSPWTYSMWQENKPAGTYSSKWRKNVPNVTKVLFGVGGPENVDQWRGIFKGFIAAVKAKAERDAPVPALMKIADELYPTKKAMTLAMKATKP